MNGLLKGLNPCRRAAWWRQRPETVAALKPGSNVMTGWFAARRTDLREGKPYRVQKPHECYRDEISLGRSGRELKR